MDKGLLCIFSCHAVNITGESILHCYTLKSNLNLIDR